MKRLLDVPKRWRPGYGYCLLGLVAIMACAGGGRGALSYTGRTAKPENVVPLAGGDARKLEWQTHDLVIDAIYALEANQLDLAGVVKLQSKLTHYPVIGYLRINAHAVDADGVILESYPLWNAGNGEALYFVKWDFQRRYIVPGNTRALTFSYRGRMQEGLGPGAMGRRRDENGGGISWDFWHTP